RPYEPSLYETYDLADKISLRFVDLQGQQKELTVITKFYPVRREQPDRIARILEGGGLYLHFPEFAPGTTDWLEQQLRENKTAPVIIIDLRDNGGGRLSVLRRCLEPFFSQTTLFGQFRERSGKEPDLKVGGRGKNAYQGRVVVLIDEVSASA